MYVELRKFSSIDSVFRTAIKPPLVSLLRSLGKNLGIQRRVISFHLNALEKVGLVKGEFGLSQDTRPQAVRYYSITLKGKEIFQRVCDIIKK